MKSVRESLLWSPAWMVQHKVSLDNINAVIHISEGLIFWYTLALYTEIGNVAWWMLDAPLRVSLSQLELIEIDVVITTIAGYNFALSNPHTWNCNLKTFYLKVFACFMKCRLYTSVGGFPNLQVGWNAPRNWYTQVCSPTLPWKRYKTYYRLLYSGSIWLDPSIGS